jgi:hypothetical protein
MPRSAKSIKNAVFNDFIYSILWEATYQEKRGLSPRLLKASMTQTAAKNFATHALWEEKQELLAHFGIEHFTVFVKTKNVNIKRLYDILAKYEQQGENLALQDIVNAKIFVTSDAQFVQLLRLTSKSIHKPQYFLNLELTRAGYHINKWKKRNLDKADLQMRELKDMATLLARYLFSASVKLTYCKAMTGIQPFEMQILLYLFVYANSYTTEEKIYQYFVGYQTSTKVRYALDALLKNQNIQKNALKPKELTITTNGINNVHNFIDEVMVGTSF